MQQKSVIIRIDKTGAIVVEAKGYKGTGCKEATAFLEKLFGKADKVELKPSYNEVEEAIVVKRGLSSGWCG